MTQRYSKAPVVEAIIDVRIAADVEVDVIGLANALQELDERYPHREILELPPAFQFASSEGFSASFGLAVPSVGLRFVSRDEKKIFQARSDGFTLSVLPPYQHWEEFRDEAVDLWTRYAQARHVTDITRIGLRYLNQFHFPLHQKPLSHFLTLFPTFDARLGDCTGFQSRLLFPQPDLEATLLLTQTLSAPTPEVEGLVPLLLDIDLFRDKMDGQVDLQSLWPWMERLRERKNLVFENCLTPHTRNLIL